MAQMNTGKFDNIYKLLSDYDFATDTNISDELKCTKCKHILIDSCQAPCGCLYCRDCIEKLFKGGCLFCLGSTKFCQDEHISNYQTDHRSNRKILQLVVKCPEELCPHKCELINMEEHLRLCSNKCVSCPIYGLGCDDDKLVSSKIGNHLQSHGFNQNLILIELIENLKNEVNVLKESDETHTQENQINKTQIEILKANSIMKDEKITLMNKEIYRNQLEIQSHKSQIEILQENARMKDQTISVMQQQIRSIKDVEQKTTKKISNLKINSEKKISNSTEEMTKEWRANPGTEVRKMNDDMEKWQQQLTKRTDEVEKWQDKQIDGTFVMKIDKISDRRKNGAWIFSPIFYPRISPYKMQLWMGNDAGNDKLEIQVCIHVGERDAVIEWPFIRNVTIQISNKAHPNVSKIITKSCQINKPNNNSYEYSDIYFFSYSELSSDGLTQNDYFIVECHVE